LALVTSIPRDPRPAETAISRLGDMRTGILSPMDPTIDLPKKQGFLPGLARHEDAKNGFWRGSGSIFLDGSLQCSQV